MPAYDYRCYACLTTFEKTQRITEPAGAKCPRCGHEECERLITGGTFHLKGAGWYASDYGSKSSPAAGSPAAEAAAAESAAAAPACGTGGCAGGACPAMAAD